MNLLDAKPYDPVGGLVTKATTSGLAMTALDTSNLRITVTVPAHGMLWVRLRCSASGGTTWPDIFLGVLEGATIRGRQLAAISIDRGTAVAGALAAYVAEFPIVGLTPGASITLDAAYGVETVAASSSLKYGGPDDTTVNNAAGMFSFEIWDPRPLPIVAPGAANGVLIAGSNAAPTFAGVNITGDVVMAGSVEIEGAIAVTADGNDSALTLIGAGTGHGILATGGGSGGDGARIAGSGGGHGINAQGGDGGGDGIRGQATGSDGCGFYGIGVSGGHGIHAQGGNANGNGINALTGGGGVSISASDTILGDLNGDVLGSVGSVVAAVTVAAINAGAITALAFAGGAITAAAINAGAITADKLATDCIGADELSAAAVAKIAAAMPTLATLADAVWDEAHAGHLAAGTFGELLAIVFGLCNGMVVVDNTTHTADGLTASRLRVFTSLAQVSAATDGGVGEGEIATITMASSYNGPGQINVFRAGRT